MDGKLKFLYEKCTNYPISKIEVYDFKQASLLEAPLAYRIIGTFREEGQKDDYNINVSIPRSNTKQDLSVFSNLYVNNVSGTAIPLKQLVKIKFETSPTQIKHYNKEQYVTITAFLKSGFNTS